MFAWLRKLWHRGEVPDKPDDKYLDWPDEEQWVFDYSEWRWKAEAKPFNPYRDEWEELVVDDRPVNLDDIPHAIVIDDSEADLNPHQCCGGHCHLVKPPPVTSVVETATPPVLSVVETEVPKAPSQEPVFVSR